MNLKSKKVLVGLGVLAIVLLLVVSIIGISFINENTKKTNPTPTIVNLEFWGTGVNTEAVQGVIAKFEQENPLIKVKYVRQSTTEFKDRLKSRLNMGDPSQLPDILEIPESWIPEFGPTKLSIITPQLELSSKFAKQQIDNNSLGGLLYGVPFKSDALVLVSNKAHLNTKAESIPEIESMNWTKAFQSARELSNIETIVDSQTNRERIVTKRSGLSIGSPANVDLASQILTLIAIQNGVQFYDEISGEYLIDQGFVDSLSFYLSFSEANIWTNTQGNYLEEFVKGNVSMVITNIDGLNYIKSSAGFDYGVNFPFTVSDRKNLSLATSLVIPTARSFNQSASEEFIKFITNTTSQTELYNNEDDLFVPASLDALRLLEKDDPFSIYLDLATFSVNLKFPNQDQFFTVMDEELYRIFEQSYNPQTGKFEVKNQGSSSIIKIQNELNTRLRDSRLVQ